MAARLRVSQFQPLAQVYGTLTNHCFADYMPATQYFHTEGVRLTNHTFSDQIAKVAVMSDSQESDDFLVFFSRENVPQHYCSLAL